MTPDTESRREVLRRFGALGLASTVGGCQWGGEPPDRTPDSNAASRPANSTDGYRDRFETITNVVAAGADNTGRERVDDVLRRAIADDTLVYFPAGTYKLGPSTVSRTENVGLVSAPGAETVIEPAVPRAKIDEFVHFWGCSDVLLAGLTFDFSRPGYGGVIKLVADGDFVARDLRIRGPLPDRNRDEDHVGFRFDVRDETATGLVERIVARDGGHQGGNGVGIFVGKDHAGRLLFRDCEVANFPNNGLYASAPGRNTPDYRGKDGVVHVRGGRYENNNIANVRLGSTDSTATGVTVAVDTVPPHPTPETLNVRGIRLRAREGQVVDNCEIRIGAGAGTGFGAISYHPDHGTSTVRNTSIHVDRDGYNAVHATDADNGGTRAPLHLENLTVTGAASDGAAVLVADRDATTLRDCTISQRGRDRTGVAFLRSTDCRVVDSTIRVTGRPISLHDATAARLRVTTERIPADTETS